MPFRTPPNPALTASTRRTRTDLASTALTHRTVTYQSVTHRTSPNLDRLDLPQPTLPYRASTALTFLAQPSSPNLDRLTKPNPTIPNHT